MRAIVISWVLRVGMAVTSNAKAAIRAGRPVGRRGLAHGIAIRDIGGQKAESLAAAGENDAPGELLLPLDADIVEPGNQFRQPGDAGVRDVMQDDYGPFLFLCLGDAGVQPTAWVAPVTGNAVPENAAVTVLEEVGDSRPAEQMWPDKAIVAVRPEQLVRMREFADERLRLTNLGRGV